MELVADRLALCIRSVVAMRSARIDRAIAVA
jgi:hypothetical protein